MFLQKYRETCESAYGVNRLYSYGTPSFISKAGLSIVEYISEDSIDDTLGFFVEKNKRGGPASTRGSLYVRRNNGRTIEIGIL